MSNLWIQLGRNGDLLSLLPLLWKDAQSGSKPRLMVAREYAPLIEGVSYVEPVIYEGPHFEIAKAVAQAKAQLNGDKLICVQVNGPREETHEHTYKPAGLEHAVTTSFVKEQWKVAGRLKEWDNTYPLVFDRRNQDREDKIRTHSTIGKRVPKILVCSKGNSSPFPHRDLLLELLRGRFKDRFEIRELPQAERIYDLLALYERAHCLVSIDSAPLHLARACPELPVIALTNDRPTLWNGSAWEPNWFWSCRYHDFPERAVELLRAVEVCRNKAEIPVVVVWNEYDLKRPIKGGRYLLPVYPGACGRDSENIVKDPKRVPFLKDCLRMGLQRAGKDEHVCLVRPDTSILYRNDELLGDDPRFAYRLEERGGERTIQPMVDLFCAKKSWWLAHLAEIPDLIFGSDYYWSRALWALFQKHGAKDVTGVCFRVATEPKPGETKAKEEPPRVARNRELCTSFVASSGVTSTYPPIAGQLPPLPLDTSKLPSFAYNPSIGQAFGKTWLTYRYHFAGDARTRLGIAELVAGRRADNPRDLPIKAISAEDARLIPFRGGLLLSWVESDYIGQPNPRAVVKYAELERVFVADDKPAELRLGRIYQPGPHCNSGTHMQKNWCFFESDENLFAIYRSDPENIVFQIHGDAVINEYKTLGPRWAYGAIRGGNVVSFGDKRLRFFHSRTDKGLGKFEPRYYVGALVMDRRPPFAVTQVSVRPILFGSEAPRFDCQHFKPNVVFPTGAMTRGDVWHLAVGVNDAACALVEVSPNHLNL